MKYNEGSRLRDDAKRVAHGVAANQSQESLDDQLKDVLVLATRFGLYDAADWLKDLVGHRDRYVEDYGELPSSHPDPDPVCWTIHPVGSAAFSSPCGAKQSQHRNGLGPCVHTDCDAFRVYGEFRAKDYSTERWRK